ncbi:MAG: zinc ribbon domain-containing protein [Candidatus Hodarchaeota archaeon]
MTNSHCPQCRSLIRPQTRFCTKCGMNLNQLRQTVPQCTNCGQRLGLRNKFCVNCGSPTNIRSQVTQGLPTRSKTGIITCPNCGEKAERNAILCNSCGWFFLSGEKDTTLKDTQLHDHDEKFTCKKCGNKIVRDTSFCKHCGNFLKAQL